jgi:hypothetical protein
MRVGAEMAEMSGQAPRQIRASQEIRGGGQPNRASQTLVDCLTSNPSDSIPKSSTPVLIPLRLCEPKDSFPKSHSFDIHQTGQYSSSGDVANIRSRHATISPFVADSSKISQEEEEEEEAEAETSMNGEDRSECQEESC